MSWNIQAQTINYNIRLNQVGFYPNLEKSAYVVSSPAAVIFTVESLDHATVFFTGTLNAGLADFSAFTTPGNYVLNVKTVGYSAPFIINKYAFNALSKASLKGYYYKRASTAITAQYGGVYARAAGHPDTQVKIHASAASPGRPAGTIVTSPKGWYDAGDYNCYVVNSNISTYTLLAAYEHFGSYYDTLSTNIPESGNGMPDILNEIKWNLDWMLTMQDPYDGAVYDKKTTANFSDFIMPDKDVAQRYLYGKSSGATYGFAAVMAVAYRVYLPFNPVYANQCLAASKKAYTPLGGGSVPYTPDVYVTTGEYNISSNLKSWAAMELYISTKDDAYYPAQYYTYSGGIPMWQDQSTLGLMSFVHHRKNVTAIGFADTTDSKNRLLESAMPTRASSGYAPVINGQWGGNSFALNEGMMDICAYELTKDSRYLNSAIFIMDNVLGKNESGYCYVTSFGSKHVMHPHDRISSADGIAEPVPGWVIGGANGNYVDVEGSFSTNEVAINWNAPLVFLSGALEYVNSTDVNSTDINAVIRVLNGTTLIQSNRTPAFSLGSSIINTVTVDAISITIKNSGTKDLIITSIISSSGFDVSALSSASPIVPGASSVFTITATPMNLGINSGTITIKTNDQQTPVFVLNVTVKGKPLNQPFLQVYNGTNPVALNISSSIVVGTGLKGTALNPITITLANEGTSPLTISSVTAVSGFEISTSALNGTIEVDALSIFTITATPANAGINEGAITIQTNDPENRTFILHVSATGLVAFLDVEQGATIYNNDDVPYVFASVIQDEQKLENFKIKNSGSFRLIIDRPVVTGPFYLTGPIPDYLDPGEFITFSLIFQPVTVGEITGTVSFGSNVDDTPFILNLSGTGLIRPAHEMKITEAGSVYTSNDRVYTFPPTVNGTPKVVYFTITNTGAELLSINDIVLTGPFELTDRFTAISIVSRNSVTFSVFFRPISKGTVTGSATISSNLIESPFILKFSGDGIDPPAPEMIVGQNLIVYSTSSSFGFPATIQGSTSAEVIFTIRNSGDATLNISNLNLSGPFELVQALTSTSIAAGSSTTFSVVFKPLNVIETGALTISSNVSEPPFVLNLSGIGTAPLAPDISVSEESVTYTSGDAGYVFASVPVESQSLSIIFTITNTGTSELILGTPVVVGPFQLSGPISTTINAGGTTTCSIVFKPITTATFTGSVSFLSNVSSSPFVLNLSGTGTLVTGVPSKLSSDAISIHPNPSNGQTSVQLDGVYTNVSIHVYNALGQQIISNEKGDLNNASFPLSLGDNASGIYFIEIISEEGTCLKRLIKE